MIEDDRELFSFLTADRRDPAEGFVAGSVLFSHFTWLKVAGRDYQKQDLVHCSAKRQQNFPPSGARQDKGKARDDLEIK